MNTIRRILSAASAISLAAALTACSGKVAETTPEERCLPTDISFDWQKPYEDKLHDFISSPDYSGDPTSGSAFDLLDITGDGTPELLISPDTTPTTGCLIYTYKDGELHDLGKAGSCGEFRYLPESGLVNDEYQGGGFVIGKYLQYSDGELKPVLTYSDNSGSASQGASIVHEINGNEVLLRDYDSALSPYTSQITLEYGRKYMLTESTVKYALYRSESWTRVLTSTDRHLCKDILSQKLADESGSVMAYEFCDLNSDNIPELLISEGVYPQARCLIYYFKDGDLAEMEGNYGAWGKLSFDLDNLVFYSVSDGATTYWSLANRSFSAADYTNSGSTIILGRKRLLTEENIIKDLN